MDGRGFVRLKIHSGAQSSRAPWVEERLMSRLPRSGSRRWPITSNSCFSCSGCGVLVAVGGIRTSNWWVANTLMRGFSRSAAQYCGFTAFVRSSTSWLYRKLASRCAAPAESITASSIALGSGVIG